jgi:hypothetical protein
VFDDADGSPTITLDGCAEFQTARAFAVLSTFFAWLSVVLIAAEISMSQAPHPCTIFTIALTAVCGVISWATWYVRMCVCA